MSDRLYTRSERTTRAGLVARCVRQGFADAVDPGLESRIEHIDGQAEERFDRHAGAAWTQLEAAKNAAAIAKVAERAADRKSRAAAKQATREAAKNLKLAERAARRYL